MRITTLALLALTLSAGPAAAQQKETETVDRTIAFSRGEANRKVPGWDRKNDNVVETRFDIQVPAATNLELQVFSSDLIVRDTTGEIDAHTFSGNIDLDVSRAQAAPDMKAETFSGDIKARMPEGSNGRVAFKTFSGDLRLVK